jgi:DNA-directed RNA polymerase specialized sigma24 family protein
MSADPSVTELVTHAARGDRRAWDALVDRYAPLVWSICRRHRLGDADANYIGEVVWLQLVSQLGEVRDPATLARYLATTTQRECGKARRATRGLPAGRDVPDAESPDEQTAMAEQELLAAERDAALWITPPAPLLSAAGRHAHRRPTRPVCSDQRHAGHPGRQHRAKP